MFGKKKISFSLLMSFVLSMLLASSMLAASFTDVPPSDPNFPAISAVSELGWMIGFGDGTFRPSESLSRQQAASVQRRMLGVPQSANTSCFPDLNPGSVHNPDICALKERGIIFGYQDGLFRPNEPVSRIQTIVMTTRVMVLKGYWQASVPDNGVIYPNIPPGEFRDRLLVYTWHVGPIEGDCNSCNFNDPNGPATRAFTAEIVYDANMHR